MTHQLFLDTTEKNLFIALTRNNLVLENFQINNEKKHTENALENMARVLKNFKVSFSSINALYITNGPGSFTGIRVSVTIAKILKYLYPRMQIIVFSSLLLQAGKIEKAISVIDARSQLYYCGVFHSGKQIGEIKLLTRNEIDDLQKKLVGHQLLINFHDVLIMNHFLALKNEGKKIQSRSELKPLYIKPLDLRKRKNA